MANQTGNTLNIARLAPIQKSDLTTPRRGTQRFWMQQILDRRLLPWLIWAIFLLLYATTAAPSIVELFDDSLEFQVVGPTFGIAHPTGYPLYVLLGGLWSRIIFPFGNWAWRMNLFSALTAAITLALIYHLAEQLTTRSWAGATVDKSVIWPGLAATVAFGLGSVWWSQATVAEVYTLHGLFVVALLTVTLNIQPSESSDQDATMRRSNHKRITLLCILSGLALAHHRTTVLVLPALALYLLWAVPGLWRPQMAWLGWLAALFVPLLLYLFIPLRAAQGITDLHGSYVNTWSGFWQHVLAQGYTRTFLQDNALAHHYTPADWVRLFQSQVGELGLGLALFGLIAICLRPRNRAMPWFCILGVLLTNLIFAINYQVSDVEVFVLPALLCLSFWIAAGVAWLGHLLRTKPLAAHSIQGLVVLLLGVGAGGRDAIVNRSQVWDVHDYATAVAKVNFPPKSRVIGLEGEATALKYMQYAEGFGAQANAVVADDPTLRQAAIAAAIAAGVPTYLTRELNGIEDRYSFSGEGPLVRVWPRGRAQVGMPQHRVDVSLADGALKLEGYDLDLLAEAGGPTLQIAFYWRPLQPLTQTLKLSLRLQQGDGRALVWPNGAEVKEDRFPLLQLAKTPHWVTGELIRDVQRLRLPALDQRQPVQPIQVQVIVYDAESLAEVGRWQVELVR